MHYATLHQVRAYLKLKTAETADDSLLKTFVSETVASIDKYCGRRFDVRREARSLDYPLPKMSRLGVYSVEDFVYKMNAVADWVSRRLQLDDDLLEVVTLTNGDEVEIDTDDFILKPANESPKFDIQLKEGSGVTWQCDGDGNREQVISVDGLWGYHDRYADAWCDSLDTVQDDPLSASATTVSVSDADGVAADTTDTRFQAGQMLQIEDEFLFVVAVDTTSNELTVTRGYNGTTAAIHVKETGIDVYRPPGNIVLAATRLVAWRYRQKDVDTFDKAAIMGSGIAIIPSALPADVRELLPRPRPPRL